MCLNGYVNAIGGHARYDSDLGCTTSPADFLMSKKLEGFFGYQFLGGIYEKAKNTIKGR